jgi:hypothetical protein
MKFRIVSDYTIEASGTEDAMRLFATAIMQGARAHSEDPQKEFHVDGPDGLLSVVPVQEG